MKNIFSIVSVLVMAMSLVFTSCDDSSTFNGGIDEETFEPKWFEVTGNNTVTVTSTTGVVIEKNVNHNWGLKAQAPFRVKGTEKIAAQSELRASATPEVVFGYNYDIQNRLTVEGLKMKYSYNGAMYDLICKSTVTVEGNLNEGTVTTEPLFSQDTNTNYRLVSNGFELASAVQEFEVREDYVAPEFEKTLWHYNHVEFCRDAEYSNGILTVTCDNMAYFSDLYSDNNEYNQEEKNYAVENKFAFSAPEIKVDDAKTVIGKTYTFANGVAVVEGVNIRATWQSAKVVDAVMHNDINYADSIVACKAVAKTITIVSATTAKVIIYDKDKDDYSEATVPVTVKENEKITLKEITKSFVHTAFRKNATVNGNNIAIVCDNVAGFIKVWSNGTKDNKVTVDYTWTNKFNVTLPTMKRAAKGKTYNFNAGTAVVEGVNVTVSFASREVSAIVFENKDYKNEAPVCEVTCQSIRFGETTAIITFVHDSETVTAEVPVSYEKEQEATDLEGVIVAGWMTDSYVNQDANREGTYLHILAKLNDGSYIDHVRKEGETQFTKVALSATEGSQLLNSGRAAAYVWNGANYEVGTVSARERSDAPGYYILTYYCLDGEVAYKLGKANQTIAESFRHPVRATMTEQNGVWSINGELFK